MQRKEILEFERQDSQSIVQYDLSKESINPDITLSDIHELSKQEFNNDTFQKIIITMLEAGGYRLFNRDLELLVKQRTVSAIVNTDKGNKFLKLVEQNCGVDEYEGGARMREYFPVIQAEKVIKAKNVELIIQPYVDDITTDKGMLTDVVGMLEFLQDEEKKSRFWQTFDEIFSRMYDLIKNTLEFKIGSAKNDRFFYDRLKTETDDGESGRLEQFYQDANISLRGVVIKWKDLIKKQWIIDGIYYRETLEELIAKSKDILNPLNQRLIALGHGDGHEMNIYTNVLNHKKEEHKYAYLDLETAGDNGVLGEGVIYLVYNSVMADYEIPKYYPEHFTQRNRAMNASFDHFARKKLVDLQIEKTAGKIIMDNIKQFGTSPIRKEIARKYISSYLYPVIQLAEKKFGASLNHHIKNTLKSVFLMRLLGVYNVSQMQALDQAKIFGLLYKTIGTTNNNETAQIILKRFIDSL